MEKQRVVMKNQAGETLKPWQVRAGQTIVSTDYDHHAQQVVCVVQYDGPVPRSYDN